MSDQYGPSGWQPATPQDPRNGQQPPAQWPAQPQAPQAGWSAQPQAPQAGWSAQPQAPQAGWSGQPQAPQAGWSGQPQAPSAWQPSQYPGAQAPAPAPRNGRTPLILTVVAVVVALVAGAGIWYFAIRDKATTSAGQASPEAAASSMLTSLSQKDVVGVAAQLDPAEAALFADMSGDILTELKRLGIIRADADPKALSGSSITTKDLVFDDKAEEKINDHVTVVKLTGGTVTVALDASKLPLSDKVKSAVPQLEKELPTTTQTIDIAKEVADNGGKPFRIATVKRGNTWYPSLFYTVADNAFQAAKEKNPRLQSPADLGSITPLGASSPEDAVNGLIDQALTGNLEGVIGMLPPDEMGVLYDYGRTLLAAEKVDSTPLRGVRISDAQWQVDDVSGGKKVSIKSLSVSMNNQTVSIVRDVAANTITVTVPGQPAIILSPDTIDTFVAKTMSRSGGKALDPRLVDIIKREFVQVIGLGVTTVQVDGKWYVSPLRSYSGMLVSLLQGLQPADIDFFIEMAGK